MPRAKRKWFSFCGYKCTKIIRTNSYWTEKLGLHPVSKHLTARLLWGGGLQVALINVSVYSSVFLNSVQLNHVLFYLCTFLIKESN